MIVTGEIANSMTPIQVRRHKSAADIVNLQLHSGILGYLESLVVLLFGNVIDLELNSRYYSYLCEILNNIPIDTIIGHPNSFSNVLHLFFSNGVFSPELSNRY